jgi:hypothetical protein
MPAHTNKRRPLGIDIKGTPELWQTASVDLGEDDGPREVKVRYKIFTKKELTERRRQELDHMLTEADEADDARSQVERQMDILRGVAAMLTPERCDEQVAELQDRILDWDIVDIGSSDGKGKLPATKANIASVCEYERIYQGLIEGLLVASGNPGKKP